MSKHVSSNDWVVLADGESYTIYYQEDDHGKELEKFLGCLRRQAREELHNKLRTLASTGKLRTPESFRCLRDKKHPPVYEIKVHDGPGHRLYLIHTEGNYWRVTHGCKKPKDSKVSVEIAKARRIFNG